MLFADNINVTAQFMSEREMLTAEDFQRLVAYLDEARLMAAAWYRAGNPVRNEIQSSALGFAASHNSGERLPSSDAAAPGAEAQPKRRGGWPAGKPRGPRKRNNPAEAMQ
jgi:hypothetical protein